MGEGDHGGNRCGGTRGKRTIRAALDSPVSRGRCGVWSLFLAGIPGGVQRAIFAIDADHGERHRARGRPSHGEPARGDRGDYGQGIGGWARAVQLRSEPRLGPAGRCGNGSRRGAAEDRGRSFSGSATRGGNKEDGNKSAGGADCNSRRSGRGHHAAGRCVALQTGCRSAGQYPEGAGLPGFSGSAGIRAGGR